MQDFLNNIDNKEILLEILHHSIDYLIGDYSDDESLLKLSNKYGFQCSDDFLITIKSIAKIYKNHCIDGNSEAELLTDFANMNSDLQQIVPKVLATRRQEIFKFLIREHNARNQPSVQSFDWDIRLIMGDSSLPENRRMLTSVTFDCLESSRKQKKLHFQMDPEKLNEFIEVLESAYKNTDKESLLELQLVFLGCSTDLKILLRDKTQQFHNGEFY